MTKIVPDVEPPKQAGDILGECPHCAQPVEGFQIEAPSRDDVVITLKPCGCISHKSDDRFSQFIDLLKASGSLY
jgi:hypothetical protein